MRQYAPRLLHEILQPLFPVKRFWIAYSGGLDSTVLLHALAAVRDRLPAPLAAVHVDHALQAASGDWARRCRRQCEGLQIPLTSLLYESLEGLAARQFG